VELIDAVPREQGCRIAARPYRAIRAGARGCSPRTVSHAAVDDRVRQAAFTTDTHGHRKRTPEGLDGRRKMTAYLR
jgi:putative transposase